MPLSFHVSSKDVAAVTFALSKLPRATGRKIVREETRRAANRVLLPAAKRAVPFRSGQYRRSIKTRAIKRTRTAIGVRVGPSSKHFAGTPYAPFQEWGWRRGRKIPGGFHLRRMVQSRGRRALDLAILKIADRVRTEWRKL